MIELDVIVSDVQTIDSYQQTQPTMIWLYGIWTMAGKELIFGEGWQFGVGTKLSFVLSKDIK